MVGGAVCERELMVVPRSRGLFVARALAAAMLLGITATSWLVLTGSQSLASAGDAARFGGTLFRILVPLQLVLAVLTAAFTAVLAVAAEKDRRTLELLLVSRLGDPQLVLGKLAGSLVRVGLLVVTAVPTMAIAALFGGLEPPQLARTVLVTAAAAATAASLGNAVAFWRDNTFQSLAITASLLAAWMAAGEAANAAGRPDLAAWLSPARAAFAALSPDGGPALPPFLASCGMLAAAATVPAILWVRRWNATEIRSATRVTGRAGRRREVWANPVLWREIRTRAHGRAMPLVRAVWLGLFGVALAGVAAAVRTDRSDPLDVATAVVPMMLASLLAVAAMGVTSVTGERDRGTLDLILASDLGPREFVLGKLLGVLAAAREMVLLPLLLCWALVPLGIATVEQAGYLLGGTAVLTFFAAVLGVYAGLSHHLTRAALAVTLGIVAFLSVGVATAMRIMVAFGASFELQLAPFLAVIVGGSLGLHAALAARNRSPAVAWASALLPGLTFVAISGFLQGSHLQVFLVVLVAYGFATAAMLVPAIAAFDMLTGRTSDG